MVQVTTTGTLILDETVGNTEDDTNLTNVDVNLAISSAFHTYLTNNGFLAGIIEEAKGLSITVDPEGSTISSLGFTKADGTPFSTSVGTQVIDSISNTAVKTIGGEDVFLFGTSDPDIVVARDSSGDLVAIFYLNDAADNLSATVEMVAFQALAHNDVAKAGGETVGDQDLLDWGGQLSVSAMGSLDFNFNNLESGKFTWVAVGTSANGMICTGSRLNIADDGTRGGSGKTASDAVNTSQGGDGATIGIDNQMFTPGDSAIFTLVKGFNLLPTTEGDATGQDVDDIVHNGYLNTNSAELFISQRQGNDKLDLTMSIFEAGTATDDEDADGGAAGPYVARGANITGSGGNAQVQKSTAFTNDAPIDIDSVEVRDGTTLVGIWTTDTVRAGQSTSDNIFLSGTPIATGAYAGIEVTITGNDALVENVDAGYSIKIIGDNNDTFNRIELGSDVGTFDIGKFRIEQGVGDTDVIGDNVRTDDDRPALDGDNFTGHVDEDELTGASIGITDTDSELTSFSYTHANLLTILSTGVDTPIHFSLDTTVAGGDVKDVSGVTITSKGVDVVWVNNSGVLEGWTDETTSRKVFTLEHNLNDDPGDPADNGDPTDDTFTFTLHDQIDHADASGDEAEREINLTPAFNAADDDGDPALNLDSSTAIRAGVENDVPAAKPNASHSEEVHEDALTGGNPDGDGETETVSATYTQAELRALADAGADEDLVFSLNTAASGAGAIIGTNVVTTGGTNVLSKGAQVMWAAGDTAGSLKGVVTIGGVTTTVFTLTPSGNDFDLTLVDQVDHSGAEDDQELLAIDLTSAFLGIDFDKDPITLAPDSVVLNAENDLPTFSAQIASKTLDWADENSVTGSLNGDVGADEPASYIIDKYTDLAGYTENLSTDGKTLTYVKDGKTFFTLALDDSANSGAGGYTFTVNEPPPQEKIEFNFDNLESGNFLWVAVGGLTTSGAASDTGLLVTGSRLNLNGDGTAVSGGKLASDQVNTSQGGAGATIGIDNQMFTPGDSGIFTFVKNYAPLAGGDGDATGQDIDQILHNGYANVGSASLFISQKQGNTKLDLTMCIYEAGSGAGDEDSDGSGGPYASGGNISGTGKNQVLNKSLTFLDDVAVALDSVEVRNGSGALVGIWTTDATAANASGVDKIFLEGTAGAEGIVVDIKTDGRAGNSVLNSADINGVDAFYSILMVAESGETFNRIELQADGGKFDIGKFVLEEGQDTPDLDLAFSVAIEDKDGDLNNFNGTNDVFDDFKIKVDGTGVNNDPNNVAPTGFATSYDTATTLTSLAFKDPGFVDDSGMGQMLAVELNEPWLV